MPQPGFQNRRCYTCGTQVSHTRGVHYVAKGGSFYFCRSKCHWSFKRGCARKRPRCVQRVLNRPAASCTTPAYQPAGEESDRGCWGQLPSSFLLAVVQQLDVRDKLRMGVTCQHWKSFVGAGTKSLNLSLESQEDTEGLSHMVHLLPKIMPDVNSLTVSLHHTSPCSQIQVLSCYTQLQHLRVDVANHSEHWHQQCYWAPALARLTQLRSLQLKVTLASLHLTPISSLVHLTQLHIIQVHREVVHGVCCVDPAEEEIHSLASLPQLQDLDIPDELFCTSTQLSSLVTLTSLRIRDIRPDMYIRQDADMDDSLYVSMFVMGLSTLPCLERLRLGFAFGDVKSGRVSPAVLDSDVRRMWVPLITQHLQQVPCLELDLSTSLGLVASPAIFTHLATLTNLTYLHATFVCVDVPAINIAKLATLTRLTDLDLTFCTSACTGVKVSEAQMAQLCGALTELTRLALRLNPECFLTSFCFEHFGLLEQLKEVELGLPPDAGRDGKVPESMKLPRTCATFFAGLSSVVLKGYVLPDAQES